MPFLDHECPHCGKPLHSDDIYVGCHASNKSCLRDVSVFHFVLRIDGGTRSFEVEMLY